MNDARVQTLLKTVSPLDRRVRTEALRQLDRLTKPPGSLGRLEETAARYVAMTGRAFPKIAKKVIYVFAGDHGVTEEGVSAYPKEVTAQMVYNFVRGGAGINVLARHVGAEVRVVDIGVDHDFESLSGLIRRKVVRGTKNMVREPAMSAEEMFQAVQVGVDLADQAALEGIDLIGVGEMGIGNTTASSAISAALLRCPVDRVTGRGAGADDLMFQMKQRVIQAALERHRPDPERPLEVLQAVGGLEIAGMSGLILGAATHRIPVVIDGFISSSAAVLMVTLRRAVRDYLFASHRSVEPGHRGLLRRMRLTPLLDLRLRLGEGTGAALAMGLIEASIRILTEMATFDEAGVSNKTSEEGS